MSPFPFRKRWLEHGPLVREVAAAIGARRYVQSHTIDTPLHATLAASRGMGEAFDGITEGWWNDVEALSTGMGTPEGMAAARRLLDDEREFIGPRGLVPVPDRGASDLRLHRPERLTGPATGNRGAAVPAPGQLGTRVDSPAPCPLLCGDLDPRG